MNCSRCNRPRGEHVGFFAQPSPAELAGLTEADFPEAWSGLYCPPPPTRLYDPTTVRWRVGRSVGLHIYAMKARIPHDTDRLIGMMDTPKLAASVVEAHNLLFGIDRQKDL